MTSELVRLLRAAYSAELAAANAYTGHARSVRDPAQRAAIRAIRDDELAHRARIGEVLGELGHRPSRARELAMSAVGWLIAASCFVGGWFFPMFGAGRIERANIGQYERAARLAFTAGLHALADELLHMAEVEHDHERYFRELAAGHWLARVVPLWRPPLPREHIRAAYGDFASTWTRVQGGHG